MFPLHLLFYLFEVVSLIVAQLLYAQLCEVFITELHAVALYFALGDEVGRDHQQRHCPQASSEMGVGYWVKSEQRVVLYG